MVCAAASETPTGARVPQARVAGPLGRITSTIAAATSPAPSATRGARRAMAAATNATTKTPIAMVAHAGTSGCATGGVGTVSSRASIPPVGRRQVNPGSERVNSNCERNPSAVHSAAISSGGFDANTLSKSGGYAGQTMEISFGGDFSG